ncbi:dTDP-4-dehydrorhamnose reductase [Caulobacter sp.]|uniref:dTDP-4-dehydrorhamnose reductase n=1 Tax=Caulobacter sp. TaxID=78 RepID=UPI003BAA52A1
MTLKVLQFGATGQVGQALIAAARGRVALTALSRNDVDLTDPAALRAAILAADCDLVINAAAYTQVDRAESEPDLAFAVNADGPAAMAAACAERDLPFVHLSTDSVFDGQTDRPYVETDTPNPISVYGRSKLAGEQAVLAHPRAAVLRISWVFSPYGRNYVSFMLRLGRTRDVLKVVADQFGSPTDAEALAAFMVANAGRWAAAKADDPAFGLFHFANAGQTSRFDFAKAAIERDPQTRARLEPTTQNAFAEAAARPPRSPLDSGKLAGVFGFEPQPWRPAVRRVADQLVADGIQA